MEEHFPNIPVTSALGVFFNLISSRKQGTQNSAGKGNPLWALSLEGHVGTAGKDAVKHVCPERAQAIKQERWLQHRLKASSPHIISNYQHVFYMENYKNPNTLFSVLKMLTFHFTAFQVLMKATMSCSNPAKAPGFLCSCVDSLTGYYKC